MFSEALKKKYKNLKTQLLREDKRIKNAKSGSAGGEKVPWKLYEHAKFILGSNISKEFARSSLTKNNVGFFSLNQISMVHTFLLLPAIFFINIDIFQAPVLSWKNSVPSTSDTITVSI